MSPTPPRRAIAALSLVVALGGAVAAPHKVSAGGGGMGMPAIVTTGASADYAMLPMNVNAGLVSLTLNAASDNVAVNVARLNPGVTQAQVSAALKKGIGPLLPLVALVGGVDGIPRNSQRVILNLTPGTYVFFNINLLTSNKPSSPAAFVTAGPDVGMTGQPASTATAHLYDMRIQQTANLAAGMNTIRIYNTGPSPHQYVVGRIHPGKTAKDVLTYVLQDNPSGPPPVDFIAGAEIMSSQYTEWMVQKFTPGTYISLCFVPDFMAYPGHKPTGKPHVALGMYSTFTVS